MLREGGMLEHERRVALHQPEVPPPGVLLGMNGLIAVTGAATLPVGAAVMTLSSLPPFTSRFALRRVLAVEGVLAARHPRAEPARRPRAGARAGRAGAP